MAVLARFEAMFDPAANVEGVTLKEPTKRLPNGLSPEMRLMEMIRRAGPCGVVKTELRSRLPSPRPSMPEVDAMLAEIEDAEQIVSTTVRVGKNGRPGKRFFHCDFGLPPIVDGIMQPS